MVTGETGTGQPRNLGAMTEERGGEEGGEKDSM